MKFLWEQDMVENSHDVKNSRILVLSGASVLSGDLTSVTF